MEKEKENKNASTPDKDEHGYSAGKSPTESMFKISLSEMIKSGKRSEVRNRIIHLWEINSKKPRVLPALLGNSSSKMQKFITLNSK